MRIRNGLYKILVVCAVAVLLAIPAANISFLAQTVNAAEQKEGTKLQDYDLVVIQDEDVPLAIPVEHNYTGLAVWVVCGTAIILALGVYGIWYYACKRRISALLVNLSDSEARKLMSDVCFFHPRKAMQTEKEIENRIVDEYVR